MEAYTKSDVSEKFNHPTFKHEEIDKIYGVLHRHLTQTFKTEIPEFPSWENMDIQENVDR